MSDWKEVVEEGQVFWVNDELGNVLKLSDGSYLSMMPLVCRLGPFSTLEEAKESLKHKQQVRDLVENTVMAQKGRM